MKQGFHGNFQVNVTWFLPCSLVSLTELCSFWYGLKNLLNVHKLAESLAIKTEDVTSSERELDPHGQLRWFRGK